MIQVLRTFFRKFLVSKTNSSIFRWVTTLVFSLVLFLSVITIAFIAVLRDREVQIPQRFASKVLSEELSEEDRNRFTESAGAQLVDSSN